MSADQEYIRALRDWVELMIERYERHGMRSLPMGFGLCAEMAEHNKPMYDVIGRDLMIGLLGSRKFMRYIGRRGLFTPDRYHLLLLISCLDDHDIVRYSRHWSSL